MNQLKVLWHKWLWVTEKISAVQSRIILGLLYFTLLLPIGVIYRLVADPLHIKQQAPSNWQKKHRVGFDTLEASKRQY